MSVVKVIEIIGRSSSSSDDAVQHALTEARATLHNIKGLDVVSVGLRGDNLDEWGALVRISFLVDSVGE
jgi:flavin-binding protein dodecin